MRLPASWSFRGFQRHARDASLLLRDPNLAGAHVSTFRRIIRVGPWGLYAMRYRRGQKDELREWIP